MKTVTKHQIIKIHSLIENLGLSDQRECIISSITNDRTCSTSKLIYEEAIKLSKGLSEHDPYERVRSLIFSLSYQIGLVYSKVGGSKKESSVRLDFFLKERGVVKKSLIDMTYSELLKTHNQFNRLLMKIKCVKFYSVGQ